MLQLHPHWTHFGAFPGAQIMHTISRFKAREVRSLMLQTVCNWELKRRSYGRLKTNHAKPKWEFRSRAPISKGVSQLRNHPLAHDTTRKCTFRDKNLGANSNFVAKRCGGKIWRFFFGANTFVTKINYFPTKIFITNYNFW